MRTWLLFSTAYLTLLAAVVQLGSVYPGDETHFLETSRMFSGGLTWELLRTYPEMSGPVPFMVFGAWGKLFGWSLPAMRICSLLIALLTLVAAWRLLDRDFHHAALLGINPYWAALSVFVYTDMVAVLCGMLAFHNARRERPVLYGFAMALALLCRQYLVFLTLAVVVYFGVRRAWRMVLASAVSLLPLFALMWLWGGPAPDSRVRDIYLDQAVTFQWKAMLGYIGVLFLYLLPWLVVLWRPRVTWRMGVGALLLSGVYWLAPVRPSSASVAAGIPTVGLVDRAVHALVQVDWARDVVYQLSLAGGLVLLYALLRRGPLSLAALSVVSFLVVMPFSYLYWEKYVLPVLPLAVLAWKDAAASESAAGQAVSDAAA